MRIISSTHDYYDGLMAVDQDRETLFLRKRLETDLDESKAPQFPKLFPTYYWGRDWPHTINSIEQYIIGFCGKIYPMTTIRLKSYYTDGACVRCFNIDEVDSFFEARFKRDELEVYRGKTRSRWNRSNWFIGCTRKEWVKFFDEVKEKENDFKHLFDEHRAPIFSYRYYKREWSLVVNPVLKDLEFYRVFPAYHAYQELVMWHCNRTNPEKPIPKTDDETMALIKGFDKYSFRKAKETKS